MNSVIFAMAGEFGYGEMDSGGLLKYDAAL